MFDKVVRFACLNMLVMLISCFFLHCRYKKLLSSVDLTKDFFFSYTYPIMCSLQQNVLAEGTVMMPYENMFVWNAFLTQPIRCKCNNTMWTIALVHGHFKQVSFGVLLLVSFHAGYFYTILTHILLVEDLGQFQCI